MVSECDVPLVVQTRHQQTGRSVVASGVEYSLRKWSCTLLDGRPRASNAAHLPYIKEVEFVLHETFDNRHRVVRRPPFRVEEEGWGEFDLVVIVHFVNCPEPLQFIHDLNFHEGELYEKKHHLTVLSPSPGFLTLFNKHSTHSRKTIPARETKARKAPPRTSLHSPARRAGGRSASPSSGYDSDSLSDGLSDSSDARSPASGRSGLTSGSAARTAASSDIVRTLSNSPMDLSHSAAPALKPAPAVKRPPSIGISGLKVPKKRAARVADDRNDRDRPPARGEKRSAAERESAGGADGVPRPSKRQLTAAVAAARAAEMRRPPSPSPRPTSASSASISPPPPRGRTTQQQQPAVAVATTAATDSQTVSKREAFIRERERQRHLDPGRDAGGVGPKAPAGLGLLGKTARPGIAAARTKRDVADIAVPKHVQRQMPPASMAAAVDAAPKLMAEEYRPSAAAKSARVRREAKASSTSGSQGGDSDDGGRGGPAVAGMALSPELVHKMMHIMDRASLLGEQAMVGFLRLLHTLRVEQEPESAVAITEEAIGQVQRMGEYSCNLSMLEPDAIDKLWAFVT